MTEKLRYIGKPSSEFEPGEIYSMIFGVHQGFFELRGPNGSVDRYASLTMLLKFWQPQAMPYDASQVGSAPASADTGQ